METAQTGPDRVRATDLYALSRDTDPGASVVAIADALAEERARVVRLFLDLAQDFDESASTIHGTARAGVRDRARAMAYDEVVREMRVLADELGVLA